MQTGRQSYKFGAFELVADTGDLWNAGRRVKLAPQPFQVLRLIVQADGSVVTREQLRAAVWADGTTVEFDQGLNYCVRQIRIALDDDARRPTYIETVPKRGYRLLVPGISEPREAPPARQRRVLWPYQLLASAVCLLLVAVWWYRTAPSPTTLKANRLFQEAEHLAGTWDADEVSTAVARYQEVLQLQPRRAAAWSGLANANVTLSMIGPRPQEALAHSSAQARRAIELDADQPLALAALGHSHWHQWNWAAAEEQFHQAVVRGHDVAVVHQLFGLYLASVGRASEAIVHARRAVELEPLSGVMNYSLAQVHLQNGQFDEALAQANRTLEIDRHFPLAYQTLVRANSQLGRASDAADALEAQRRYAPEHSLAAWRAYLLAREGRVKDATLVLEAGRAGRSRPRGSIAEAAAFVALGNVDAAFECLNEGVGAHVPSLLWLQRAPELASIRGDARFAALLARMNMPRSAETESIRVVRAAGN